MHGNETLQNSLPVTTRLDSTHFNVDNNGNDNGTQLNIMDVSALQDMTLGVHPTAVLVMLHESSICDIAHATFADDDNAAQSQSSVTYRVISKGSTNMRDHLTDRAGHSYTMKPTNRPIKYSRCTVRNKETNCELQLFRTEMSSGPASLCMSACQRLELTL